LLLQNKISAVRTGSIVLHFYLKATNKKCPTPKPKRHSEFISESPAFKHYRIKKTSTQIGNQEASIVYYPVLGG